jgi:hypothetical protein
VVLILKIPKGDLEELAARIESLPTSYFLFFFGFILIVYFVVELCRMNGRLAMLEIYQTEATYHNMKSISMVTLANMLILLAFLPRVFSG